MAIVSRLELDHPALDDPGGNALHTQVEGLYIKIGDNLSARYFEGIAVANGATVIFDHNFKMPFDELAFKVYLLAGAGGELTVTTESDYDIVATPGNLTTQISVTNNSGGVSTFAVLIQSIGGAGGGGGTELYDVVVDAAGGGDYTEIRAAILAEPTYSKIFIKDGSYSETLGITLKFGQKIVGQSKAGVILTTSALINLPGLAGNTRGVTQRTTDNTDWDGAASAGLITMTANNATASYSGSFLPVANDMCLIGPGGDMFDIISVSAPNVTLDRPWRGATGDVMDWIVLQGANFSDWKEEETWLKNMTIIMTSTNSSVFNINRSWKNVLEDLDVLTANTNTGFTGVFYFADSVCKNTFKNISVRCTGFSSSFSYMQSGGSNNEWINCSAEGMGSGKINGTATRPFKYMDFSFTDITQSGAHFINTSNFVVYSTFKVDRLDSSNNGIFPASGTSTVAWYSCEFVFGFVGAEVGLMSFNCGKSRLSIKRGLHTRTDIANRHVASGADPEFYNTIHDSNLSGTIQVQAAGDLIVSSSVTYGGFFNANLPSYNVGFDFTKPPGGFGQTLYDVIISANGGGDYTSIRDALLAEPNDTTFYIRNGSYAETFTMTIKLGQKLIGETADGVILTSTVSGDSFNFSQTSSNIRGQTNRISTNYDWDSAANIGLLTVTSGSATATYSGSLDPVTNDIAVIGTGLDKYDLVNVDGGTNTVTLDRPWRGASGVMDWDVWLPPADSNWKNQSTEVRNMTIITTASSSSVFSGNRLMNCLVDNIKIQSSNTSGTNGVIKHSADTIGNIYSNIESTGSGGPFIYISNVCSFSRCKLINIKSHGHVSNRLTGFSSKPIKYNSYHFNSISSGSNFWSSELFSVHNIYKYDYLSGATNFGTFGATNNVSHFGTQFYFGIVDSSVFRVRVDGAQCIVSIKNGKMSQNVEIKNIETTLKTDKEFFNILTESFLKSPINVTEANLVVSGSVIYGGKIGAAAFAQDNGFDHTL